jgi:BlaI family penicillinase repressor
MATPDISPAEWTVMEVLWKRSPRTASEVFKELQGSKGWALNTVRTMLSRLVDKGALRLRKNSGGAAEFLPAIARKTCVKAASESFLQRVFQGAANSLLLHFVENSKLTEEESRELRRLFDKTDSRR